MTAASEPFSASAFTTFGITSPSTLKPERPMLSRDADAMYWMARYVERAEHVARMLIVNSNLLIDVGDLAPALQARHWQSLLTILRLPELPDGPDIAHRVRQHLMFDADNPNSILSCLTRARENARGIRENISAEMWENLNTLYWSLRADDAQTRFDESPDDLFRSVMIGSMLFQGLTDQTLAHDQRWLFAQLAKYLERTDVTCRIIQTKYDLLMSNEQIFDSTLRNLHWMALLRSCCSIEAYRQNNLGDMDPMRLAAFLILERNFPRSIRFTTSGALAAISAIRAAARGSAIDPAERILGRLDAQLEYAELSEILAEGVSNYLRRIEATIHDAAVAVQRSYFLH
ncbi:MAG: alpha-E domain-containing protein [Tepidisphaeraceae bacterium]